MAVEIDAVIEALVDNADWQETNSVAKARLFVTAAKRFLILSPQSSQQPGGFQMTMSVQQIKQMLDEASSFVTSQGSANDGGASVRILGVRHGFR